MSYHHTSQFISSSSSSPITSQVYSRRRSDFLTTCCQPMMHYQQHYSSSLTSKQDSHSSDHICQFAPNKKQKINNNSNIIENSYNSISFLHNSIHPSVSATCTTTSSTLTTTSIPAQVTSNFTINSQFSDNIKSPSAHMYSQKYNQSMTVGVTSSISSSSFLNDRILDTCAHLAKGDLQEESMSIASSTVATPAASILSTPLSIDLQQLKNKIPINSPLNLTLNNVSLSAISSLASTPSQPTTTINLSALNHTKNTDDSNQIHSDYEHNGHLLIPSILKQSVQDIQSEESNSLQLDTQVEVNMKISFSVNSESSSSSASTSPTQSSRRIEDELISQTFTQLSPTLSSTSSSIHVANVDMLNVKLDSNQDVNKMLDTNILSNQAGADSISQSKSVNKKVSSASKHHSSNRCNNTTQTSSKASKSSSKSSKAKVSSSNTPDNHDHPIQIIDTHPYVLVIFNITTAQTTDYYICPYDSLTEQEHHVLSKLHGAGANPDDEFDPFISILVSRFKHMYCIEFNKPANPPSLNKCISCVYQITFK